MRISAVRIIHLYIIGGNPSIPTLAPSLGPTPETTMSTITVQSPIRVVAPRGAAWAAALALRVLSWVEATQSARAERREQANRQGEATALRQHAMRFARHDPRFTADLMAAADRHERGL